MIKRSEKDFEEVTSLQIKSFTYEVGLICKCCCDYEIVKLYPIWDIETKKHLVGHDKNRFSYKLIPSAECPLHHKLLDNLVIPNI